MGKVGDRAKRRSNGCSCVSQRVGTAMLGISHARKVCPPDE